MEELNDGLLKNFRALQSQLVCVINCTIGMQCKLAQWLCNVDHNILETISLYL